MKAAHGDTQKLMHNGEYPSNFNLRKPRTKLANPLNSKPLKVCTQTHNKINVFCGNKVANYILHL